MKKIIIVIVIIFILGFSYYYFIPTKRYKILFAERYPVSVEKETKDWNLYKNSSFGFSIKYPSAQKYEEPYTYKIVNFYPPDAKKLFESDKNYPAMIQFGEIDKARVQYDLRSEMDRKKYKLVNGIEIIKFTQSDDSRLNAIIYVNGKIYEVFVTSSGCDCRNIFDKMLPTIEPLST